MTQENQRQECTVYSRVVGWITPTKAWNPGKRQEFDDRKEYEINSLNKEYVRTT